jgi:signal transduction histidine kinase
MRTLSDVFSGVFARHDAVRAAQRSAAASAAVLGATSNPVAYIDHTGIIREANEAWTGEDAACGTSLRAAAVGTSYVDECRDAIARGDTSALVALEGIEQVLTGVEPHFSFEYPCAGPDGERWFAMRVEALRGADAGAVVSHIDITAQHGALAEIRRHQEEVAHLSRTRTMGEFAASMAHELSQPLAAILANAQAARRFLAGGRRHLPEVHAILDDIDADDQRAGEMIRRMRALFKRHEVEVTSVDLNEVVREATALVHSEAVLRRVTMVMDLADGLSPVRADRIQVQQVLLNLILNAFEAIAAPGAQGPNRRLVLRTSLGTDGYVDVSVRDSGPGIPPEHFDRLFRSYFTTKRDGLGMGLSISQAIAQGHGGRLWATNNSDSGATFHLALPLFVRTSP